MGKNNVGVASAHFGKEETTYSSGEAARKEDCSFIECYQKARWTGVEDSLHRTAGVPILLVRALNAEAEMIAPALPDAAEIPCAKAR